MPYLYICIASILFSVQSIFTKQYQRYAGDGLKESFLYNVVSPLLFIVIMFFYDGMRISCTPYSLVMAIIWAIVCNGMSFFQIKALSRGKVANYSLFLLGGGMILPIIYGAFCGEDFGVFKIIGIILVCVAIFIKIDVKEKSNAKTFVCLIAIFILNGLAGVLSAVYQSDLFTYDKISSEQFSILRSITTVGLGLIMLAVTTVFGKKDEVNNLEFYHTQLKASPWALISGGINGVANLLLLFSLNSVQASLQYPIITGGGIFLSALVGLIVFGEKADKKTWISVAFAVAGTIVIML